METGVYQECNPSLIWSISFPKVIIFTCSSPTLLTAVGHRREEKQEGKIPRAWAKTEQTSSHCSCTMLGLYSKSVGLPQSQCTPGYVSIIAVMAKSDVK